MALAVLFITFIGKFKLYGNRYKKSFTNKVTSLIKAAIFIIPTVSSGAKNESH